MDTMCTAKLHQRENGQRLLRSEQQIQFLIRIKASNLPMVSGIIIQFGQLQDHIKETTVQLEKVLFG